MQQKIREKVMESLKYLVSLVNDVLGMNKLQSGDLKDQQLTFDLTEVLQELNQIYDEMGKKTKEARCIDCECCGYESCEKMAFAIYNGFNKKENCIHFVKDIVEEEKKRALELADEIKAEKDAMEKQQENIKTTVETVNDLFV